MFHKLRVAFKKRTIGDQHIGHRSNVQTPQLIAHVQPRRGRCGQGTQGIPLVQPSLHGLSHGLQKLALVLQAMRGEGKRHVCLLQVVGIRRGKLPMLEFIQPDQTCELGVGNVVALGEIDRDQHPDPRLGKRLCALVPIATSEDHRSLDPKLFQHGSRPQGVLPVSSRKHPGKGHRAVERLKRQVGAARRALGRSPSIPVGIEMGLTQQGRGPHQRAWVVLRRRALSEAHVERGLGCQECRSRILQRKHHRPGATYHPILNVGQQGAKTSFAQRYRHLRLGIERRRSFRFRTHCFVPAKRSFFVAEVLWASGPTRTLNFGGAKATVEVDKGRVKVQSCHVQTDGRLSHRRGCRGAHGHNAALVHDHRAILHHRLVIDMHGGMFKHRGNEMFVVGSVDGKGGVEGLGPRLGSKQPGQQGQGHPSKGCSFQHAIGGR